MQALDTIVALSTPPGRSGIGVIRISGQDALPITRQLLRDQNFAPISHRISLRTLYETVTGNILDRAIVSYFQSPQSFTGEDIVELSCHGSPPLLLQVLDTLLQLGARMADPGEFTLRALSNKRLNLIQAEAIRDLINARTNASVRQAARQLGGELSARLQPVKDALLEIIVPLESSLEFVEDDLPADVSQNVALKLKNLVVYLEELARTFKIGRLLKEGLRVALVGRPNVGKSSLFNRLLLQERAIVTDAPGTTRDSLSEVLEIDGIPVLLTDTAGVRASTDQVEKLGIERTRQAMVDSDVVVVMFDGSSLPNSEDLGILRQTENLKPIIALNKCDLSNFDPDYGNSLSTETIIPVSAKTGVGLDILRAAIIKPFSSNESSEHNFVITTARHYDLLQRTVYALDSARNLLSAGASEELVLSGLYDGLRFLGEITGETTPDDVLSQIFATFCIGK